MSVENVCEKVKVEYEVEYQPVAADADKKMNIKFYDDSPEFSDALSKLSGLITKNSEYNFEGCEITIKEEPKAGKPTKIELCSETIKGTAGIRFFSSKKKGENL